MLVLSNLGKDSDMDDPRTVPNSDLPAEFEDLLAGFTGYLQRERSLATTTVENYLNQVLIRSALRSGWADGFAKT